MDVHLETLFESSSDRELLLSSSVNNVKKTVRQFTLLTGDCPVLEAMLIIRAQHAVLVLTFHTLPSREQYLGLWQQISLHFAISSAVALVFVPALQKVSYAQAALFELQSDNVGTVFVRDKCEGEKFLQSTVRLLGQSAQTSFQETQVKVSGSLFKKQVREDLLLEQQELFLQNFLSP